MGQLELSLIVTRMEVLYGRIILIDRAKRGIFLTSAFGISSVSLCLSRRMSGPPGLIQGNINKQTEIFSLSLSLSRTLYTTSWEPP